ncbi:MAG: hypothetical protein DMD81_13295 [Candidatus Rokuibacteriota bacterium]|nr:MAG: hypothetical protein DMD81_13295 [Candidatus Rokubacteria bacterium]
MASDFDRKAEDVGNILQLEHVNVRIPDQQIGTLFYVIGLGFTRDPYLNVGLQNMWINLGQQQFHLPTAEPQVVRGVVGLCVPSLDALVQRLDNVKERLAGTKFSYAVEDKHVSITTPWGNKMRAHGPSPEFGDMTLGMPYVEFPVPQGHATGIARFYREVFGAVAGVTSNGGVAAHVKVGPGQELIFAETTEPLAEYDGHHIAIYVSDFGAPHRWLVDAKLLTEESNRYQYRFKDIVDPDTKRVLFTLEHEVRCATHPMYLRPMVNRNPAQIQRTYVRGRDAYVPGME